MANLKESPAINPVKIPYKFKAELACALDVSTQELKLVDENMAQCLCQLLGKSCYTHLLISDGLCCEVVEVRCYNGCKLQICRGQEGTERQRWPALSEVSFEMTPTLAIMHIKESMRIEEEAAACNEGEKINGLSSDTLTITRDEDDPACTRIEVPQSEAITICTPGFITTFENGTVTQVEDPSTALKDGVVHNATLCIKDNKIVDVEAGDPLMGVGECLGCGCKNCECPTEPDAGG